MTRIQAPEQKRIAGRGGVELMVDHWTAPGRQPVILLHGGGQTRHAWGATGQVLAERGYDVTSMDLRGHGDSQWCEKGDYSLDAFRDDVHAVMAGCVAPPVLIGASLGGMASMLAAGEGEARVKAVVLVDITHRVGTPGTAKITGFMTSRTDGFATLEEAVEAVAAYLPHRPKPANPAGLMKNLRERNGRLHWHWDPNFLSGTQTDRASQPQRLADAVQRIAAPTLLVRGDHSEIVSHEDVEAFQALAPHAEAVVVKGASHMVAGDENTAFGEALLDFLERNAPPKL